VGKTVGREPGVQVIGAPEGVFWWEAFQKVANWKTKEEVRIQH
jgi:hypothetical protein